MAARTIFRTSQRMDEKGQSLLEVLLLVPFLFMFVGLLYKMTMATQMAIVNAQYARSQVYVLTSNSPEYPRLQHRWNPTMFATVGQHRMVLGVSDPSALTTSTGQEGTLEPTPQTQNIARNDADLKGSSDRGEVSKRTVVRVRNTAAICTQLNQVPLSDNSVSDIVSKRWPFGIKVCQYGGMI